MAAPLKDMVDRAVVEDIARRFAAADVAFDDASFTAGVMAGLLELELKARIELIARSIAAHLDGDYRTALGVVVAVAGAEPHMEGFAAWPLCTFVEIFGVGDPAASLPAMEHLTKRASCEFAIRPFLRDHWETAYGQLVEFTTSVDEAVRRLSSEGTRPRLPWGTQVPRLIQDPGPGLALLTCLRHDPAETVRRSVANHLNDVAKDHPDLVVSTARLWTAESPPVDKRMIAHALRTLVKLGHTGALDVLGFTTEAALDVLSFNINPASVAMGDHIELEARLRSRSRSRQRLVVDFVVHHVNASGATSPKVFKWTILDIEAGETVTLRKRRLIQHASTRSYHRGTHLVELQVAGTAVAASSFHVEV